MALQIKVPGGHVHIGTKVRRLTDNGIKTENNWVAICEKTGETIEWATREIAEFWLSLRYEHYEWLAQRARYS